MTTALIAPLLKQCRFPVFIALKKFLPAEPSSCPLLHPITQSES